MDPQDWFWEGHVQRRVADRLRADGWTVVSSADTASRQTGVDLIVERDAERMNIEVKGWPSTTYRRGPKAGEPKPTNPTVQARHWFAAALLTTALLRDACPDDRVVLAFPDFPRYRDLLRRTSNSLSALRIETLLVGDDGAVQWADPAELQPVHVGRAKPQTPRVQTVSPSRAPVRGNLTLHEAMTAVLRDAEGGRLPVMELAIEINRRDLYRMRDGRPVEQGQIHARARNYAHLFEVGAGVVNYDVEGRRLFPDGAPSDALESRCLTTK